MKTTQLIKVLASSTFLSISLGIAQAQEAKNLVSNGDFSKSKLEMWLVGVTNKYGQELEHKVTKKSIQFKEIREMSPKYVTLGQYVDIEKGKTYQVSFDTKTSAGAKSQGGLSFSIGRPGFARLDKKNKSYDHARGKFEVSDDWKTTTVTFTGLYDTDNKDYAGRKVKGADEKSVWEAADKETQASKGPTWIVFNIGGMTGDFHLQNVVIKEVAEAADTGKAKSDKEDEKKVEEDKELTREEKKAARKEAKMKEKEE